jgi:hypothetical protein
MFPETDTKDPTAVEMEVQSIYLTMFPKGDRYLVPRAFGWVMDCFHGNYRDYLPIDALYHDLEHTLQGTLCLARLLHGRQKAGAEPVLTRKMFELSLLAILQHDTGYLKHRGDDTGTGAKYTLIHVTRSADFAEQLLSEKKYHTEDIRAVQNMIRCTGINADLKTIPFQNELERITGFALATSDLVGQMAASDYIEKLPILYLEFAETARFNPGKTGAPGMFASAEDLIRRTPAFWEKYVIPKIDADFLGLYRYLSDPYPDGPNQYIQRIERNIAKLSRQPDSRSIAAESRA